jgi:hypothetical protein
MSGLIGLVELGTICGIRFPAGKSYHGVDGSPCTAGITYGADLAVFVVSPCSLSADAELPSACSPASAAFFTASRSLSM